MKYFLGIDVGSSKTHALIANEEGMCIGFGQAGGGNHQGVGYERLTEVLQKSFEGARQTSAVAKEHIAGAGFGVAGYDFPSEREAHLQAVAHLVAGSRSFRIIVPYGNCQRWCKWVDLWHVAWSRRQCHGGLRQ
jgi:N-acetylglucosamine kinase-like BadF-type ATPase